MSTPDTHRKRHDVVFWVVGLTLIALVVLATTTQDTPDSPQAEAPDYQRIQPQVVINPTPKVIVITRRIVRTEDGRVEVIRERFTPTPTPRLSPPPPDRGPTRERPRSQERPREPRDPPPPSPDPTPPPEEDDPLVRACVAGVCVEADGEPGLSGLMLTEGKSDGE